MVGTSGSTDERLAPPVPSARSLPDLMCGVVCTSEENITLVWPPITSIIAGPPPLNGTCSRSTPASSLNSSPPRCWKLPTHHQHVGAGGEQRNGGERLDGIVIELVEPGIDGVRDRDDEQGVTVR